MPTRPHILVLLVLSACSSPAPAQHNLQNAFPNLSRFSSPIEIVHAGDGSNKLYVVEQFGRIYAFPNSQAVSERKLFIDLSDRVSQTGGETGLLGLAFHPDYTHNGYFYVNYTRTTSGRLQSFVSRFKVSAANPGATLKSSELVLLTVDQPFSNHSGDNVRFDPDGYLYLFK